jgi:hypothetical protein
VTTRFSERGWFRPRESSCSEVEQRPWRLGTDAKQAGDPLGIGAAAVLAVGLAASAGSAGPNQAKYKIYLLPKNSATRTSTPATRVLRRLRRARGHGDVNALTEASGPKQVPFINTAVSQLQRDRHLGR